MSDFLTLHHSDYVEEHPDVRTPDPHQDLFSKNVLGFWVYLMTDCVLFGALFTTYAVLHGNTFGGPSGKDIFSLKITF
ncbi:MAG: cytochrome o ubiquinol oxidase subunit III, partial [Parachlamydiaceae bacterium]|nr:cytochrome o ubiquinol oxidase subunit III [Parachlamydiaceae bacterium]